MNNPLPYNRLCYIKILAAIVVVISHLTKNYDLWIFNQLFDFGTYSVALFFFLSGYGLKYSLMNKTNYLNQFFTKRIPKVAVPYIVSTIAWIIISSIIYPQKVLSLLDIFSYYPILPFGWYFVILIYLYILFYLSYRYFKSSILLYLSVLVYYIFCYTVDAGEWVYTTTPCFILGILCANYPYHLRNATRFNLTGGGIMFILTWRGNLLRICNIDNSVINMLQPFLYTISSVCFVAITVILLNLYKLDFLNNPRIKDVSYEIYLAQCIGLPLGNYIVMNHINTQFSFSFIIPIIFTIVLIYPFYYLNRILIKQLG